NKIKATKQLSTCCRFYISDRDYHQYECCRMDGTFSIRAIIWEQQGNMSTSSVELYGAQTPYGGNLTTYSGGSTNRGPSPFQSPASGIKQPPASGSPGNKGVMSQMNEAIKPQIAPEKMDIGIGDNGDIASREGQGADKEKGNAEAT